MENLNAEQIIQGLRDNDSPYKSDQDNIMDAIALIKSQEQRIKELTEENERLREKADRAYANLKAVLEERKGDRK